MKRLAGGASSRALDEATKRLLRIGTPVLIEKASLRLWDALRGSEFLAKGEEARILALCGKGGNGEDALALLRHAFCAGFGRLEAVVAEGAEDSDQAKSLAGAGIRVRPWAALDGAERRKAMGGADLVLDGILGAGAAGLPRGEAASMIEALRSSRGAEPRPKVVSLDLPSGLWEGWRPGDPAVEADLTLGLEPLKTALYLPEARKACGAVLPVGGVFPEVLTRALTGPALLEAGDLPSLLPPLDSAAYKMGRGRVAVFAGSRGGAGAARLCAKAAAAAGAGYVTLYADEEILPSLAAELESVVTRPLDTYNPGELRADLVLAGPGWGEGKGRPELLESLAGEGIPLVLDAEALRLLAVRPQILARAPGALLCPHPGEFAALAKGAGGGDFSLDLLERTGAAYGALIAYKSHVSWLRGPEGRLAVWDGMTAELGTAGSGDVLAGLAAGLAASALAARKNAAARAQGPGADIGEALFDAAQAAVLAHGLAGKELAAAKGWFEAAELLPACAKLLHGARPRP